jgi:outer membrane protein TolC
MDKDWQRGFTRILARLILAYGLTTLASAQTPAPKQEPVPQPSQTAPAQPDTPSQTMPAHLAGVEADKVLRWTLKDAILAALENNPDIEIARQNVRLSQFGILAAQGVYDPLTTSALNYNSQKTPNVSRFSDSSQNFLQNDAFGYNFGHSKLVERTGGAYQINFNNSRVASNAASQATSYNPALTATLTQPRMKNFGIDSNRHLVQIAKKKLDLSDAQFRQQVIQIITNVQETYWNLAFAIRSEEIQRDALNLAEKQLENNREQAKVGTLAQLDVINAAAQVESVRQQVFLAMQTVAQAADALKSLTVEGPADDLWSANIGPC